MTTAQRAKEMAAALRTPLYSGQDSELATILGSYARMLEAALPESVLDIERRHADTRMEFGNFGVVGDAAHADRATLLHAVRSLTAEMSSLHDKHNAAVSELIMKWNVSTGERDAASAEVERLREECGSYRETINRRTADMVHARAEVVREKQRADRMAEGIFKYRAMADAECGTFREMNNLRLEWEREHGHLV